MNFVIGLVIALTSLLGGFAALGGHLGVIWQPWEFVIIGGSALGTFIIANPLVTVRDSGKAVVQAILGGVAEAGRISPGPGCALRADARTARASHAARPKPTSTIRTELEVFKRFDKVLKDKELTDFICDYGRLIIIGNARPHEIEALMDEEIQTHARDELKPYYALASVAECLPALGIVAAVLGVIKAMGALDQSPDLLGHLIGAALVGTFAGIFLSYGVVSPLANKIKVVREKRCRILVVVKQTLLAFMNGAMPQIALEHGRKTISAARPPDDRRC